MQSHGMPAARYKNLLGTQMPMALRCQNPHHPMASPPFSSQPVPFLDDPGAAGMVPGSMVGGLPPDIWVTIFQGYPQNSGALDALAATRAVGNLWGPVVASGCSRGPHHEQPVLLGAGQRGLGPGAAVQPARRHSNLPALAGINVIMHQCSKEAQGQLGQKDTWTTRGQEDSATDVPRSFFSPEGTPAISMGTSRRRLGSFHSFTPEIS